MEVNITLNQKGVISIPGKISINDEEELILVFDTDYFLEDAKIELKNGSVKEIYNFKQTFMVPYKFIFKGMLFITLTMNISGNNVKKWEFTPICIKETSDGLCLFDFFTSFDERLGTLEKFHEII